MAKPKYRTCAIFGCKYDSINTFHKFPKDKKYNRLWLLKCGRRNKVNIRNAVVCDRHFSLNQKKRNMNCLNVIHQLIIEI